MAAGVGKLGYPISQKADSRFWIKECPKLEIRYASVRRVRRLNFITKKPMGCRAGWVARSFFRAMVSVLTENNSCRSNKFKEVGFVAERDQIVWRMCDMAAGIGKLDYPISQKADYGFWIKKCPKLEIRYASLRRIWRPEFIWLHRRRPQTCKFC